MKSEHKMPLERVRLQYTPSFLAESITQLFMLDPPDLRELMTPPPSGEAAPDLTDLFTPPSPFALMKTPGSATRPLDLAPVTLADGADLYVGLDAEWVADGNRNQVLSYQTYCINEDGTELGKIYYADAGKRFGFEDLISMTVEDCRAAGVIKKWPRKIIVVAHFLRADLSTFQSFWKMKTRVNGQGGSVVGRVLTDSGYGVDETAVRSRKASPAPILLKDKHRKPQKSIIQFVDTLFLAPNKSPLSALGDMLGLPKVEIPAGYSIERMNELLAGDKAAYERYALRDAELAVKYALKVRDYLAHEFKLTALPRSLGAVGVNVFRRLLAEHGIDDMASFGMQSESHVEWNSRNGKVTTKRNKRSNPSRRLFETLAIDCYMGGRNESFMVGPTIEGHWYDWDLKGAYTTGLCYLLVPDYAKAYMTDNPNAFVGHVMGFAYVAFKFPVVTRYPCIPVRSEQYGLRFPLEGDAYVTAPEIELALAMGAAIEIKHGVIVPWVVNSPRLFESFTSMIQKRRKALPKKSLEEVMIKEIGNSLYGKLAQGLSDKTAFDTATGLSKKIGPSAVTNPYMAAHTTGLIRAVCGELLHRIPSHRMVVSVTTDGFLTDAPWEELDQTGPLCRRYQALCQRLHGSEEVGQ